MTRRKVKRIEAEEWQRTPPKLELLPKLEAIRPGSALSSKPLNDMIDRINELTKRLERIEGVMRAGGEE